MVKKLSFYDLKSKKKFNSTKYRIEVKNVKGNLRKFAVATKGGREFWRVLPKDF